MPFEFWIGRLCEEFHCLPSAAFREWLRAPAGFLEEVIEIRAYAEAKRIYDAAENKQQIPKGPIFDMVKRIDLELAKEALDARRTADG